MCPFILDSYSILIYYTQSVRIRSILQIKKLRLKEERYPPCSRSHRLEHIPPLAPKPRLFPLCEAALQKYKMKEIEACAIRMLGKFGEGQLICGRISGGGSM